MKIVRKDTSGLPHTKYSHLCLLHSFAFASWRLVCVTLLSHALSLQPGQDLWVSNCLNCWITKHRFCSLLTLAVTSGTAGREKCVILVQAGRVTQSVGTAKAQLHVSATERTLNWPAKELQRVREVKGVSLSNIFKLCPSAPGYAWYSQSQMRRFGVNYQVSLTHKILSIFCSRWDGVKTTEIYDTWGFGAKCIHLLPLLTVTTAFAVNIPCDELHRTGWSVPSMLLPICQTTLPSCTTKPFLTHCLT